MPLFEQLALSDASILKVTIEGDSVVVVIRDWRELLITLVFEDTVGVEAVGWWNEDLSHADEAVDDKFLKACLTATESLENHFRCFRFYSAWTDMPVLKVVAGVVRQANDSPVT